MPPKFRGLWNRIRLRNNPSEANLTGLTLPRPGAIAHLPKWADYFTSGIPYTRSIERNRPHQCGQQLGPGRITGLRQWFGGDLKLARSSV